jgi:molybdopterin converting factor small subunit
MKVEVELIAYLKKYAPADESIFDMELDEGATVNGIVTALGISAEEARITLVNGRHAKDDAPLHDGDTVALLTPVEGG